MREYRNRYYAENRERCLTYESSEKKRLIQSEWRERNRELHRQRSLDWAKRNPENCRANANRRRARKNQALGSFTKEDVRLLFEKQDGQCAYCNINLDNYHVDHVIPLSKGGSNFPENLAIACSACNLSKQAKTGEEFLEYLAAKGFSASIQAAC